MLHDPSISKNTNVVGSQSFLFDRMTLVMVIHISANMRLYFISVSVQVPPQMRHPCVVLREMGEDAKLMLTKGADDVIFEWFRGESSKLRKAVSSAMH